MCFSLVYVNHNPVLFNSWDPPYYQNPLKTTAHHPFMFGTTGKSQMEIIHWYIQRLGDIQL